MGKNVPFSEEELKMFRESVESGISFNEIKRNLEIAFGVKRSMSTLYTKAYRVGIKLHKCEAWNEEEDDFLKQYYGKVCSAELKRMHDEMFPIKRSINGIRGRANKLGLNETQAEHWSDEEIQFLRDNANGISFKELSEMHNKRFPIARTEFACQRMATRIGVTNGRDERIQPNEKGKFRKEIGSVVTDSNGDVWVKVKDDFVGDKDKRKHGNEYLKNYKRLAHINWEKENPPLKDGEKLLFLDGDHSNCDVSNLELVTDKVIVDMARNRFHDIEDPQLKQCAVGLSKLNVELNEYKRGKK